jgi:hypothetical protein
METARILVTNNRATSRVIYVEPWGADYTLRAGEVIEIIARARDSAPWFDLIEKDDATLVYIEGEPGD